MTNGIRFGELFMLSGLINKTKNIGSKEILFSVILLLFLTDIVRIFNVPYLKEILPLIYFTIVPGVLIVILLNLNKLEFIKKFVLWIGLSVSFLIFVGLGLNSLYPILSKPLSLLPLLFTFNVLILLLALFGYRRNKKEFEIQRIFNFSIDRRDKLISPMIFTMIFPLLAIYGTYLMNMTNNNSILLLMLFLIPIYFVLIIGLRNKISNSTYPFAILMVSLSIFLMHGLTSNYLIGRDNHLEFYCFQYTLLNLHWDQFIYNINLNSCLSITILPTIYSVITSIQGLYIFKIVFGFIGSIIPLIIYIISKEYVGERYAIFAALLIMFQMNFIELLCLVRQEFAFMFFFLAIMVLFDHKLGDANRKILFVVFMLSVVVSHYTSAFIGLALTVPILLTPFLKSLLFEKKIKLINFDVLAVLGFLSFIWYFIVSNAQKDSVISTAAKSTGSVSGGAVGTVTHTKTDTTILSVFGMRIESIPQLISVIVNDAIFLVIGIGLITALLGYKYYKDKIPFEFIVGSIMSTVLLVIFISFPYFSHVYGASRIFLECLVFLAPMFVIGGIKIAKTIKRPKLDVVILVILLISLFSVSIHFNYYFSGIPSSIYYDANSNERLETYIYDQDICGAEFLSKYGEQRLLKIHADAVAGSRLMFANNFSIENRTFISYKKTFKMKYHPFRFRYLYLTYVNTQKNRVYEATAPPEYIVNATQGYKYLNDWKSRIYDDGGSMVLIPY